MTLLFAANLLAAAMTAPAAVAIDTAETGPGMDLTWIEYQLAAAAQPGDAISDYVLAEGFRKLLDSDPQDASVPAALRNRLEAERQRLMLSSDRALMDDPMLLSIRLSCHEREAERDQCDVRRERLAEMASDNAYAAMVLMSVAFHLKDDAGFVRAAAMGADARRYEPAYHHVFASMDRRFRAIPDVAVPGMPRQQDGVRTDRMTAMSLSSALSMPAYQWFSQPCRHAEGGLRTDCIAIAHRMVESETVQIDVLIGAGILNAVGNDEDRRVAETRKREVHWLQSQQYRLLEPGTDEHSPVDVERYFDAMAEKGELPAMRAVLESHGLAVQPPAGWTSADWRP